MRRTYPERKIPSTLRISQEYMSRESSRWERDIRGWITDYLKRNKIKHDTEETNGEIYFRIDFPSRWRQKIFILKGNQEFPYFEFH